MKMLKKSRLLFVSGLAVGIWAGVFNIAAAALPGEVGVNYLKPSVEEAIDDLMDNYFTNASYINIGIVYGGQVVFTRCYKTGLGGINTQVYNWASVSKTLTTMIAMQLVEAGVIDSVDDNIWKYDARYNHMPPAYSGRPMTIKHVMTHYSGFPDYSNWSSTCARNMAFTAGGYLDLRREPGSGWSYSTMNFSVVGDMIITPTGKSYSTLVQEYICDKIGAQNLYPYLAFDWFYAPGGNIRSTIYDMALYAAGVMNNTFISSGTLYSQVLVNYGNNQGLGFRIEGAGDDIMGHHSGSTGASGGNDRNYIRIKPKKKIAACLLGRASIDAGLSATERAYITNQLVTIMETSGDPLNADTTPPSAVAGIRDGTGADIDVLSSSSELSANWDAAADPEGGIAKYWYAIGTIPGGTDIAGWTDNGVSRSVTRPGLALQAGTTYYFTVKAENGDGLEGAPLNSDGQYLPVIAQNDGITVKHSNLCPASSGEPVKFQLDGIIGNSELKIYTISGRLVKTLRVDAGTREADWNLLNENGGSIRPGIYLYTIMDSTGNKKTGKVVISR